MLDFIGDYMKTIRLIAVSLLLCISYAIAETIPEGMLALDPGTKKSLKLYMSVKGAQGDAYVKGMLEVAKESPNICLRYLSAKTLAEKRGSDVLSIQANTLGESQLKNIFLILGQNLDKLRKDCSELKSNLASDVIKTEDDPYHDFVTTEINPLFQREQHIHVKLKIAEYSNDPLKLLAFLQEPYIKDDTREKVLLFLKDHHSNKPHIIAAALLKIFDTANTLTLKESCLRQLLNNTSHRQSLESGLKAISQAVRTRNVHFCSALDKTTVPPFWPDLEAIKIQTSKECKVFNDIK